MPKIIHPNSCAFCELTHDKHGSRLDGLHPSGVWTWVEPSDKLRLERMRRNRQIRKGITMNPTSELSTLLAYWVGRSVTYHGVNRRSTLGGGRVFNVVDVRKDGNAVAIAVGGDDIEWVGVNSVKIVNSVVPDDILTPHATTISALDSEIKRLEEQIQKLRAARQVISGL